MPKRAGQPGASLGYGIRRFTPNVVAGVAAQAVRLATGMFLIGYLVRKLGSERWGLIVLSMSLASFISLIELTASAGIAKKLTEFRAQRRSGQYTRYLSAGIALSSALAVLMLLVLALLLTIGWEYLGVAQELQAEGRVVVGIIGVTSALMALTVPFNACLQSAHRLDIQSSLSIASVIGRTVLVVMAYEFFAPYAWIYAAIILVSSIPLLIGPVLWVSRNIPEAQFVPRLISYSTLLDLFKFNALIMLNSVNYVMFMQTPAILLQRIDGSVAVGNYGIALQLTNMIRALLVAANNALNPVVVAFEATRQRARLQSVFLIATKTFVGTAGLLWIAFYFLGDSFLDLWLSSPATGLKDALPWLIGASAVGIAALPSAGFLVALERMRGAAIGGFVIACSTIPIMWLFATSGVEQVLPRVSIVLFVAFGFYQLLRIAEVIRVLQIGFLPTVRELCLRPLLPLVGTAGVLWATAGETLSLAMFLGAALGSCAIFGSLSALFLYSPAERALLVRILTSRSRWDSNPVIPHTSVEAGSPTFQN